MNADIEYLDLLHLIREQGISHNDRTGVGTKSLFGYQFQHDLSTGFPLLTTKRLSFRWIAEELFWFLSGSTNVNHLRERCDPPITIWDEWATEEQCAKFGREAGDLGPIYGHQWRNYGATNLYDLTTETFNWIYESEQKRWLSPEYDNDGFDQIKNLMDNLESETGRLSRRLIISGWNPAEADQVALPPCHTLFQFKYHEELNRLDMELFQRSADVFLGVPYNIASYSLLLHLVAECCGMAPGVFTHSFGDVHIYNNHIEQVDLQLSREPRDLPEIDTNFHEVTGESCFDRLMQMSFGNLRLENYNPHPAIKAKVAV